MNNVIKLPVKFKQQLVTQAPTQIAVKAEKPSKSFLKYQALLNGKRALLKNEILSLSWVFNRCKKVNITPSELDMLWVELEAKPERPISKEQTKFGIDWLNRMAFKVNGEKRNYKDFPFGPFHLNIIKNFQRFAWIGYHNTQEDYGNYNGMKSYTPVWRTYAKDGSYFDYHVCAGGPGGSVNLVIW